MPPVVVTYLGFPVMLALLVGVHFLVRNASRRALGASETTSPLWRRLLATSLGAFAGYVTCAIFFLAALLGLGQQENTLRVTVTPSGPAYEEGLRDGDRVVAVNGAQPSSWEEFRFMVRDSAGAPIGIEVDRDGQIRRFNIQPRDGQIGVGSIINRNDLPLARATAAAIASPIFTIFLWARELTEPRTLMGPVGYAVTMREPSPWPLVFRLGELGSYAWPFSMLIVFVVSRRRRQT